MTPAQVFFANFVKSLVAACERLFFRTDLLVAALVKISEYLKYRSSHPQNDVFFNYLFKPDFKNVMRNNYSKTLQNTCKLVQFDLSCRPTRFFI